MSRRWEPYRRRGVLGRTHEDSEPVFPVPERPDGPNVVLILFDDLGFADFGCYGSEIRTPNIDSIADGGHRYTNFHTTTLCSPSRAAMLTGRNHHSIGMRMLSNVDSGWPSGRGRVTREAAFVSEILRDAGYDTFATGKWHLGPMREATPAGPFDEWPLGRGFNRFYGFLNGAADHFYPELVQDNHIVDPPSEPEDGYHLTDDLIDRATQYVADHQAHRPDDPFFLYVPLGVPHAPHHAPADYLEEVRGRYDEGWDVIRRRRFDRQLDMGVVPAGTELPPSNPDVPAWDSLSAVEQRIAARLQEAYAAFIEHADAALGRLFDFLDEVGVRDDTVIIITSDNGAAMEGGRIGALSRIRFFNNMVEELDVLEASLDDVGGPRADSHYAVGWAQASNTPGRWYKYHTHGGGIRDPFVVSWPGRLAQPGAITDQFHHMVDVAPTLLELAGLDVPETVDGVHQMPMHGASMAYTFTDPTAATVRRHQYFEMFGNRAIWADGWKAVTHHDKGADYGHGEWELYHLDADFSEAHNLAEEHPEKLQELIDLWWSEAEKYDVLPLDDRSVELYMAPPVPGTPAARTEFTYLPPISRIEKSAAPSFEHADHHVLRASLAAPFDGVVVSYGNRFSGFVLYAADGVLHYEYNAAGDRTSVELAMPGVPDVDVAFEFALDKANRRGKGRLHAGAAVSDWVDFPNWLSFLSLNGMDIGVDSLSPVSESYRAPFPFKGSVRRVTVSLVGGPERGDVLLDD